MVVISGDKKASCWRLLSCLIVLLGLSQPAFADAVQKAESWFANVTTMRADFTQIASDGSAAEGRLVMRRPSRLKITYNSTPPLALITTPVWLHVDQPDDRQLTSYPISETPLSLLLKKEVRLRSDAFTTSSNVENGIVRVLLAKETGEAAGELTLEFTEKPFVLRKWTIRDAADVTTTVTLQNMRFGHQYENRMFARPDYTLTGSN